LLVSNDVRGWAPTNGAAGGNGGAAAPPGDFHLQIKNSATQISTESVIGKSGDGGLGGKAGRDAATCAITEFNCEGYSTYKLISFFREYHFRCTFVKTLVCKTQFPSSSDGLNGMSLPNLEMRSYKVSVTTSTEQNVHEYCKIAAASAALKWKSLVMEFLQFVFSMPGAKSYLQDGNCMKKL